MSLLEDTQPMNWNTYDRYHINQVALPRGSQQARPALHQGNLVIPTMTLGTLTYSPQVAVPGISYMPPFNMVRPYWPMRDVQVSNPITFPLGHLNGRESKTSVPPTSSDPMVPGTVPGASTANGFMLPQGNLSPTEDDDSLENGNSQRMKSETNPVCQDAQIDESVNSDTRRSSSPPKQLVMSVESLSSLPPLAYPAAAIRGNVGLQLRQPMARSPSVGRSPSSLSCIPLATGSSLNQLWASQSRLSINSVSNLKGDTKFPTLEAQYFGGSLPDLSLGTLQRLLPSTPNLASNESLSRCASGMLYLIPSQPTIPPIHSSAQQSPSSEGCTEGPSSLPRPQSASAIPEMVHQSTPFGGSKSHGVPPYQHNSSCSTPHSSASPPSSACHQSPVVPLLSPPVSPDPETEPSNVTELTQYKIISPSNSVTGSTSMSPQGVQCGSPLMVPGPQQTVQVPDVFQASVHRTSASNLAQEYGNQVFQRKVPVVVSGDNGNFHYFGLSHFNHPTTIVPSSIQIKQEVDGGISPLQHCTTGKHERESFDSTPLGKKMKLSNENHTELQDSPSLLQQSNNHQCEHCGKDFVSQPQLKAHIDKVHACHRPCVCEFEGCGKRFFTPQHLTVHRRSHTGERPYVCPYENCHKAFTTAGNLKNHIRTHTGERPYGCKFPGCERRFAEMSSLKKHELTHTGEKPYACRICGKCFSQAGSRNTHEKRHTKQECQPSVIISQIASTVNNV